MRSSVQEFATSLLDYVRSSKELEIMLNYDPDGEPWEAGDHQSLERLKLAIKYKQKMVSFCQLEEYSRIIQFLFFSLLLILASSNY